MKYYWTRPYCTYTYYKPVEHSTILSDPWCAVCVRSSTFSEMTTYKPMPAGMRTGYNGHEWYSREYLQHADHNFNTEAEAKAAAEKWVREQLKSKK